MISLDTQPCSWSTAPSDKKCFGSSAQAWGFTLDLPSSMNYMCLGTLSCVLLGSVSALERDETAAGSVSLPRGHNDLSNGP